MEKDEIQENDDSLQDETVEEEEEEEVEETDDSEDESEEDSEVEELRAEAAKWKAIAQRKKKKKLQTTDKEEVDEDIKKDIENLKLSEKKRQFGYEHGLSPEETDRVFQIDGNPSDKTLKDPFVKAGLKAIRRQKDLSENIPSSQTKSSPFQKPDFRDGSPEDKQKAFQEYVKSKVK